MRALLLPCLAVCSIALSGCSVYSAHPLANSEDAVEEPALVGAWTPVESGSDDVCIQKADGHGYSLIRFDPNSKLTEIYQIDLVRLNDQLFADMVFKKEVVDRTEVEPALGTIANHVILKVDIADDDLTYYALDPDAIREQNKQGSAPVQLLEEDDTMLLTASTDEMREYLSAYADRVFVSGVRYTRKIDAEEAGGADSTCGALTPP
jgi:hypothetical protein